MLNCKSVFSGIVPAIAVLAVSACSGDNLVGVDNAAGSASADLTKEDLVVRATKDDSSVWGTVRIPQGTQLFDENGNVVSGQQVTANLDVWDGTPNSEYYFDGGTEFTDANVASGIASVLNKNLNPNNPIEVDLAGWVRINVVASGIAVKTFGQPISVQVKIEDGTPRTLANFSVDQVTIDRAFEGALQVQSNGHVQFTTDHLTAFGFPQGVKGLGGGGTTPTPTDTPTPTAPPTGGTGATGSTGATGAGGS